MFMDLSTLGPGAAAGTRDATPSPGRTLVRAVIRGLYASRPRLTIGRNGHVLAAAGVVAAAAVFVGAALAAGPNVPWTLGDMKTAVRAIGYPKPHPKTLSCKGYDPSNFRGYFASFRCVVTYTHHHRRAFYIQGEGEGGWLCAGTAAAACHLLRRGFVTTAAVSTDGGLGPAADLAAQGWLLNTSQNTQKQGFCTQTASTPTTSVWSCPFVGNTVALTLRKATGGYVSSASVG